jgi:enamine deaminase RidA (YjgF/YER057c/UK114 family)
MAGTIDARIAELGITLPPANKPAGNYVPWVISGNLVFISGQIPMTDGKPSHQGKLGAGYSSEDGAGAAKVCALAVLAQLKDAVGGDLDRVARCVRVGGFVNSAPDFTEQPKIVNGASDLIVAIFGDAGRHARAAVGVAQLPAGVSVEVEAIFEIR